MIVINTISSEYFELNGIQYAKIYQPLDQGVDAVGIYSIFDTRLQLVNSTKYDEYLIDGVTYGNKEDVIENLLPVIYSGGEGSIINQDGTFGGFTGEWRCDSVAGAIAVNAGGFAIDTDASNSVTKLRMHKNDADFVAFDISFLEASYIMVTNIDSKNRVVYEVSQATNISASNLYFELTTSGGNLGDIEVGNRYSLSLITNVGGDEFIEPVDSLRDLFQPSMIRNIEQDAVDDLANETKYLITSINVSTKVIELSQPLPYLGNPQDGNKIWGLFNNPADFVAISNLNYITNEITYSSMTGTLSVGDDVQFYNPFRKMEMVSYSPLIDTPLSGFAENFITCAGVWKHSDGGFRMIVVGRDSANENSLGYASSTDLENWILEDEVNAKYKSGVAPFNKSWCDGGYLSGYTNPIPIQGIEEDYYYQIIMARDTSSLLQIGAIIMDEDFNIIKVADNAISIPGHTNTHGFGAGSISYYDGVYHVGALIRAADLNDWKIYDLEMGDVLNGVVNEVTEVTGSSYGTAAWNGSHVDGIAKIVYKGEVLTFVAGTGHRISTPPYTPVGGVLEDNRTWGLMTLENGVYTPFKANPIFSNPISGNYIWDDVQYWCSDHTGANLSWIIHEGYLYFFMAMAGGTDTYKVAGVKYYIGNDEN